jgi:rhodanese-related sulfurtransferase/molybdopterin-guanine dinucleotide biosynthesis protein A
MGTDKSLLAIGGRPMAVRVAGALVSAGAAEVATVGGDVRALSSLGLRAVADRWPGEGPLGGVIEALRSVGSEDTVVVLACDLVHPDASIVSCLAGRREASGADLVVPVASGRPQWTHAAWRRGAAAVLEGAFSAGERSLARAAGSLPTEMLHVHGDRALADADAPSDLPGDPFDRPVVAYDRHVDVPETDVETLSARMEEGAEVFDVRQPDEYEQAHVPGVRLVPLDQVPERLDEFPSDDTVFVICRTGARSARAVEFLRANGVDAVNVAGGTVGWIDAGKHVDTGA